MPMTQLPSGQFPHGGPIVPAVRAVGRGKIFYVGSAATLAADDTSNGDGPFRPYATLNYAVSQTTTGRGDTVVVLENHAETLSAASAVNFTNQAGVKVVGFGVGAERPTFTFATNTNANVLIGAANVELANLLFVCNVASHVTMLTINGSGSGAYIHDCEFREGTQTGQNFITITGTASDVRIENNRFFNPTAGNMIRAIYGNAGGAFTRARIKNNVVYGNFSNACVHSTNAFTLAEVTGNNLVNLTTGAVSINFTGTPTGIFSPNYLQQRAMHDANHNIVRHVKANVASGTTAWTTANSPVTVFTVTGTVLARCWGVVGGTAITSTATNGTLALGVAANTGAFIAATTADSVNFSSSSVWVDTTPTVVAEGLPATSGWFVVNGNIIVTIATNNMLGGAITLYCEYIPLSLNSAVVSATSE